MKIKQILALLTVIVALLDAMNCDAASYTFNGSASGLWNVNANWTPSTGFPIAGDTAIIPTGKSVTGLGGANQACATLTIQGTGTLTVDANTLTVSGTMTVGSSGSSAATLTIASGGTLTMTGTGSGLLAYSGTSSVITNMNGGVFNCASGHNFSGTTPIFGNNGTVTFTGTQQNFNGSSIKIVQGPNGVLNLNGSSSTPFGGSTILDASAVGNTVNYGYTGAQNIYNNSAIHYYNLTFSGSSAKSFGSNKATIDNRLSFQGTATANGAGNVIYGAGSTLEYKGSAVQTTMAVELPAVGGPPNLTINNGNGVILGANAAVSGTLALVSGTFNPNGKTLSAGSVTRTSGNILLSVTAPTVTKVYDGGTTAGVVTVGTLSGFVSGQTVAASGTMTGTYSGVNVGSAYSATVSYALADGAGGGLAANYILGNSVIANASITKAPLAITAPTVTKVYNGTTTAGTVTLGTLSGFVGSETVTATGTATAYSSANVGSSYASTVSYTLANGSNGGLAANYSLASSVIANASITPATPVVSWSNPADIIYGTALSATQLNATSGGVAGIFVYTPPSGTLLNAASSQILSVQFTPTDTANYNTPSVSTVSINVNQANSSITYGMSSFTYNGTAQSPSVSVTDSTGAQTMNYVGIAPTSYGPSTDAPKNAGTYGLTNTILADANHFGATNGLNFTIAPTNITVTAQPNTKTYDATTVAATVPTITSGSLQGTDTANFTETYDTPNVGTSKTLTAAGSVNDGNGGNNYNVTFVDDTAGVIESASVFTLISSINPSAYNDSVFFTATNLPAGAVSNVVFSANGVAFSTNDVVDGGTTSLSITNLPRGTTNEIVAVYNGDGINPSISTNLIQTVTNHPPVAGNVVYTRNAGTPFTIIIADLLTNATDLDGDILTVASTGVSTNGINLSTVDTNYLVYSNINNVADQFSYEVIDGYGGTNMGTINIVVSNEGAGEITGQITSFSNNMANLAFYGIPNFSYITERSTNLNDWVGIATNSVATNGVLNVSDSFSDLGSNAPPSAFYRLKFQP